MSVSMPMRVTMSTCFLFFALVLVFFFMIMVVSMTVIMSVIVLRLFFVVDFESTVIVGVQDFDLNKVDIYLMNSLYQYSFDDFDNKPTHSKTNDLKTMKIKLE